MGGGGRGSEGARERGRVRERRQTIEANYALGTKVVWSGITSTSRSLAQALEFARGGGVVFRVR